MGRTHHSEVPSGRETHNANTGSVDMHGISVRIDELQRLFDVDQHIRILVAKAQNTIPDTVSADISDPIFENKRIDTMLIEPLSRLFPLIIHVMPTVTSSRAYNHSYAGIGGTISEIGRESLRLRIHGERQ